MLKTIIFDMDETLYSYTTCHRAALEEIDIYCQRLFGWDAGEVKKYWQIVFQEVKEYLGFDNANIHDITLRVQLILEKKKVNPIPYARKITDMYWNGVLERMQAYDWVVPFLKEAKEKGYRLGIATDLTAHIQYLKLERLGLTHMFDFIVTSEEAGVEKPHSQIFRLCLNKAGCRAGECLMIGDNWEKDMVGAIDMGMHYAWHTPGKIPADADDRRREAAFFSLEGLRDILERCEQ